MDEKQVARAVAASLERRVAEQAAHHVVPDREDVGRDDQHALVPRARPAVGEHDDQVRE
jgi:hypothetical protein